jgi:hypothetical protein
VSRYRAITGKKEAKAAVMINALLAGVYKQHQKPGKNPVFFWYEILYILP